MRLGYVGCEHFGADIGLASVRADHAAFYRRVFLQEMMAPARLPPGLIKPVCLMAADYRAVRERIFQRYPYFRTSLFERRMLFERRQPLSLAPICRPRRPTSVLPRRSVRARAATAEPGAVSSR